MKIITKNVLIPLLVFTIFSLMGCAPSKTIWTSKPDFQSSGNDYYDATITPIKDGNNFYVSFRLDVFNKQKDELKIDWNRTMYIRDGGRYGVFVFKGIKPEDIKNQSVPDDTIPPGIKFSKIISPYKMLARAPISTNSGDTGINPGILPDGENGVYLVVRQSNKEIAEKLSVTIKEIKE